MTVKTCRTLQIVAVSLFAVSILIILIGTLAQAPILRLAHAYIGGPKVRSFPFPLFLSSVLYTILAVVFLILLFRHPSNGTVKGTVIALAALLFLLQIAINPLVSRLSIQLLARKGSQYLAQYTSLLSVLSSITQFFVSPAVILMLITMGASLQTDFSSPSLAQPPIMPPYNNPYPPYPYQ